jgi:hypothetical protein
MPSGTFEGYYRVTEILEPYSGLSEIPKDILEKAADRGDRVHNFCELYANGLLFQEIDEDCKNYVDCFKEWFDKNVQEVVAVEERFFCEELKITGQVDLVAIMKGDSKPSIIDFKTPASVSKTWNLQLAAYDHLARQKYDISRCFALQLPKTGGSAKVVESEEKSLHFFIYKGILDAHKYFFPI